MRRKRFYCLYLLLKLCTHPQLKKHGYHIIHFMSHRYLMLYRIEGTTAYVDAIYHDAASSIVRLGDMGVENYLIANSLVGMVAQRLMRKV